MPSMSSIRSANGSFAAKRFSNPVAVFVGGSSGIGMATMKAFAKATVEPRIYFVGRNESAASKIKDDITHLNPSAKATFIKADLTELKNVCDVADRILKEEKALNLLVLSQGYMTIEGRIENSEGLEKKMVINYYGRILFALRCLPLLLEASDTPLGSRVMSVFAAGGEAAPIEDDLELKKNFTLKNAGTILPAYNTFAMEHLSETYPQIGWIHTFPGLVPTGLARGLPGPMRWASGLMKYVPFGITSLEDTGEGHLWLATDESTKTGLTLKNWKGDSRDTRKGGRWYKPELVGTIWKHTEEVFTRVMGNAWRP